MRAMRVRYIDGKNQALDSPGAARRKQALEQAEVAARPGSRRDAMASDSMQPAERLVDLASRLWRAMEACRSSRRRRATC